MSDPTPAGWASVRVGDVAELNPRQLTPEPSDDDVVSFVPMAAVEEQSGRLDASRRRPWREVRRGFVRFQDGDVLFAKITPCMENGKFAVARALAGGRAAGSTEFHVLRSTEAVIPEYLLYFLLQESVRRDARLRMQGAAGQLRVPRDYLAELLIPLAPLAEQRRIVAAIEEHLSRLDAAVAGLKRVLAQLPRYRATVLKAAVEGRLLQTEAGRCDGDALPTGWRSESVADLAERVDYGTSAKTAEAGDIPVLRMGNIRDGTLVFGSLKYLPARHPEFPDLLLRAGDVLFNRTNSAELVGKSAVYSGHPSPCSFASYLIRVRLRAGCLSVYFVAVLNSLYGRRWIADVVSQQVGQANVSGGKLKGFKIPLPPEAVQERIVAEIERCLSVAAAVEQEVASGLAHAERLRQGILRQAFEGKLVPQDPNDEPASVLLERIRAARVQALPARRPRRARRA